MEISAPLLTARLWRGMSRRHFLWTSAGALAAWMLPGCGDSSPSGPTFQPPTRNRLTARPGAPTQTPTVGLTPLGIGGERDGFLYVPESYSPETPAPLFIALHGAGGSGSSWVSYPERAEARGMILLTPDSRASTWDLLLGGLGPDVDFLDLALQHTFERCRIDPTRLALGGFSDGASYTFSVGLSNGDLFSHLVAYSPGFVAAFDPIVGQPPVYVSHGTNDTILPVSTTRDLIVPTLSDAGYDVTYEEFGGGHELPSAISESALDWFLDVA